MNRKAFKYRIYPNKATIEKLQWVLDRARELYNAGLQERRDAYEMAVKRHPNYYDEESRKQLTREHAIGYFEQKRELVDIKEIRPEYQEIASHVLQDVIMRLKKTYDRFFERCKNGENPGYPRFKGRNQYDSFTYPDHAGWKLEMVKEPDQKRGGGKATLHLSKIGEIKINLHRELAGKIKTCTIKREGEHWYCVFTCEIKKSEPLPVSYEDVGIDLGVTHFAALSNGEFLDHPRYFRNAEKKLARLQQVRDHKKRGSHRRAKATRQVARAHRKIKNQRRDWQHKQSHKLINRYQGIVFEDLQTANLTKRPKSKQDETTGAYLPNGASAKAGLNKSILDAGWATFTEMCRVKAESAGRSVIFVNPFKTSQICSGCGAEVKKDLSERWHSCTCGCEIDRDTNAAKNILTLGYKALSAGTRPTPETV